MSISEHASKPSHGMKHGYVLCISWGVPRKWEGGGGGKIFFRFGNLHVVMLWGFGDMFP